MHSVISIYKERVDRYANWQRSLQKKINLIGVFRMIIFVVLAVSIYYCIKKFTPAILITAILPLIVFIILVKINFRLLDKRQLCNKLLFINQNELSNLQSHTNAFDNGKQFISAEGYSEDLDIFGENSLFHLLNRTTTSHGKERLASMLKNPLFSKNEIEKYQEAVRILSADLDNRQLLTANGL